MLRVTKMAFSSLFIYHFIAMYSIRALLVWLCFSILMFSSNREPNYFFKSRGCSSVVEHMPDDPEFVGLNLVILFSLFTFPSVSLIR